MAMAKQLGSVLVRLGFLFVCFFFVLVLVLVFVVCSLLSLHTDGRSTDEGVKSLLL
jgi:preprotein translocase subunit SecG